MEESQQWLCLHAPGTIMMSKIDLMKKLWLSLNNVIKLIIIVSIIVVKLLVYVDFQRSKKAC